MVESNENMGWGEVSTFSRFNISGPDLKRKEALDQFLDRRECVYNFLEENYMSCVEFVRSSHNEVKLICYKVSDLAKLVEDTEIPISRKGKRYLEDKTNRERSINREFFCIAFEQYGNINQLVEYCRTKPTSR
jgi:hypothetical protein